MTRALPWLPAALLTLVIAVLAVMFAVGDTTRMTAWYLTIGALPLPGAALLIGVLGRVIWKRGVNAPRIAALVVALVALVPISWGLRIWPVAYPSSLEDAGPGLAIRVPTDAPMRVAWGGDSAAVNQHAVTADQRWAYDLVSEPYFMGSDALEDYGCFGIPVVAPLDGVVAIAEDGQPDQEPGEMDPTHALGNHVVIEPSAGGYLIIAHLRQGSVTVRPGQSLREGEPIGACGNSGNTSEPHVHIHYQRQSPRERPLNFADGLPLYFRDHQGPAMPSGGLRMEGDRIIAIGDEITHRSP